MSDDLAGRQSVESEMRLRKVTSARSMVAVYLQACVDEKATVLALAVGVLSTRSSDAAGRVRGAALTQSAGTVWENRKSRR